MTESFPAIRTLVNKLDALTPPAQTSPTTALPGTVSIRRGVLLAINNGPATTITLHGGVVEGDPNNNYWGPTAPIQYPVSANSVVVAVGPSWFSFPCLGPIDTSLTLPRPIGVIGQPPKAWAIETEVLSAGTAGSGLWQSGSGVNSVEQIVNSPKIQPKAQGTASLAVGNGAVAYADYQMSQGDSLLVAGDAQRSSFVFSARTTSSGVVGLCAVPIVSTPYAAVSEPWIPVTTQSRTVFVQAQIVAQAGGEWESNVAQEPVLGVWTVQGVICNDLSTSETGTVWLSGGTPSVVYRSPAAVTGGLTSSTAIFKPTSAPSFQLVFRGNFSGSFYYNYIGWAVSVQMTEIATPYRGAIPG
jgi:hypothetical protein